MDMRLAVAYRFHPGSGSLYIQVSQCPRSPDFRLLANRHPNGYPLSDHLVDLAKDLICQTFPEFNEEGSRAERHAQGFARFPIFGGISFA